MEIPSTEWREEMVSEADARKLAPVRGVSWRPLGGLVRHTFTHFHLELTIMAGLVKPFAPSVGAEWVMPDKLGEKALPSVMRKVVNHALKKA